MGKSKITMNDFRKAKMCSRGTRRFFEKHNFDYSDFLKNGIDPEKLLSTNDAMVKEVVEIANGRQK